MDQQKIGVFLKQLRNENGFTQEMLAGRLNVSGRTVSRWENGNSLPDISMLIDIAEFYGVDVREIIEGERRPKMDEEVKDVACLMADYAENDKHKLMRWMQNVGFAGMFLLAVTFVLLLISKSDEAIIRWARIAVSIAFVIMGMIALFFGRSADKGSKIRKPFVILKRIAIVWACTLVVFILIAPRLGLNVFTVGIKDKYVDRIDTLDGYYVAVYSENTIFPDLTDLWRINVYKRFLFFSVKADADFYYIRNKDNTKRLGSFRVIRNPSGKTYYYYSGLGEIFPGGNYHYYDDNITFQLDGKQLEFKYNQLLSTDVDCTTGEHTLYMNGEPIVFLTQTETVGFPIAGE